MGRIRRRRKNVDYKEGAEEEEESPVDILLSGLLRSTSRMYLGDAKLRRTGRQRMRFEEQKRNNWARAGSRDANLFHSNIPGTNSAAGKRRGRRGAEEDTVDLAVRALRVRGRVAFLLPAPAKDRAVWPMPEQTIRTMMHRLERIVRSE